MRNLTGQSGSALVEAAILFPCLLLILFWSIALTDVLVLKLKASEAARFALWETTAWRSAQLIDREVAKRFPDLRSPAGIEIATTGLLTYPRSSSLQWTAEVDTAAAEVKLAGSRGPFGGGPGILAPFLSAATRWMASGVQAAMRAERFDTWGVASARARLVHAGRTGSWVLAGGDLPGRRGGNDLGAPRALAELALASPGPGHRPLQLVFDTWKAWPRPAPFALAGAPADLAVGPQDASAEVEKQVAAQLGEIAFFGMRRQPWFAALDSVTSHVLLNPVAGALVGGHLPRIFSTGRMDSPERGPVTILPQGMQRAGDIVSEGPKRLTGLDAFTEGEDGTRSTVPHAINTRYWISSGGTEGGSIPGLLPLPARLGTGNPYVRAWSCRGRFFAGSIAAQEPDLRRRYRSPCR
jgi:hypothetical protein